MCDLATRGCTVTRGCSASCMVVAFTIQPDSVASRAVLPHKSIRSGLTDTSQVRLRLPNWGWFLLAAIVLVTVAVGLELAAPIYRQCRTVQEVKRLGGRVVSRKPGPEWLRQWVGPERMDSFGAVIEVHLAGREINDAVVGGLGLECLTELQSLSLRPTSVNDAGLAHLSRLRNLRQLDLSYSEVADAGMKHLRGLRDLQELHLAFTRVSDAGLTEINALTSLRTLDLGGSRVSSAGLARLNGLTNLQSLDLDSTGVNAACLQPLQGLSNLKQLSLIDSQTSAAGVQELESALPSVRIRFCVPKSLPTVIH